MPRKLYIAGNWGKKTDNCEKVAMIRETSSLPKTIWRSVKEIIMAVNQLKAGAALSYITILLSNVIGLLYTPFMLRMMGQSEYGLYSLVASVVAYLTVLDLGFGNAIVRYTAKFRSEGKIREQYEMFGMFFLLYIGIGMLAIAAGMILYFNVDNMFDATMSESELDKIRIMMLLMVFNIAFTFPMSIWGSIINAYENFVFQKVVGIVRVILNPIAMIIMLLMGYRAVGMVVVTTVFNVVTLLINFWYCRHHLNIKVRFGKFKWGFFKEVAIYSFWIFLNAIMDRVYWSTGQFVLGMVKGAASVAVYAVAITLQSYFMSFSTSISGVFLPRVTGMISHGCSDREVSDLFIRTGRIQFIVMAFVLTGFVVFGKSFIAIWAGNGYEDAYTISLLFFVPLTVPLIQNLGITILQARNQMKFRSVLYVVIALASLGISIPLSVLYGGIGCAVGTASALVAGQIIAMNIYYYKKIHIDIPEFWREIGKMAVFPVLFCGLSLFLVSFVTITSVVQLAIGILVFSVAYLPGFWFSSMNQSERKLIGEPVMKLVKRIKR